jgi:hypothetical protein
VAVDIASKSVVKALLAAVLLIAPATAAAQVESIVRISGVTPYPNGCGVTGEQTPSSEAEPMVAANPLDPNQVLAVYQQDRFSIDGGALADLASISGDGGKTFTQIVPPQVSRCNGGPKERASDPWISFGPDGTAYAAWLTFDENPALGAAGLAGPTALSSQTSSDGGRTWKEPVSIVDANIYDDREAVTADPNKPGVAYVAWVRRLGSFGENGQFMFAKTTDGAKSWSAPQSLYTPGAFRLPDPILIDVMPDGTLVATFVVINASYAISSSPVPLGRRRRDLEPARQDRRHHQHDAARPGQRVRGPLARDRHHRPRPRHALRRLERDPRRERQPARPGQLGRRRQDVEPAQADREDHGPGVPAVTCGFLRRRPGPDLGRHPQ